MMASSRYETRLRSPNVQNTTAATWESSAKYWIMVVPPANKADSATPASTMDSGVISRNRERPSTTSVDAMAPRNAHTTVT